MSSEEGGIAAAAGRHRLTIVAVGASAGGLKALQAFFERVPTDSGMAFVVIMHLDPDRESRIAEILQDRAAIPVTQVMGSTRVQPDHVYVIPPGLDLFLEDASIHVRRRNDLPQHAPIDLFFRTLAEACGPDAIAVVLSGTGSDGAAGLRYVKEQGGIVVAQAPGEADFDGMPSSAIATGQVDLVLPAAAIPLELLRFRRTDLPIRPEAELEAGLAPIFAVVRAKCGHDFSRYKRTTVLRRLDRRLRFNGVRTLEEYLPLLQAGDAESAALVRDLLISVSGFFRDPAAFQALAEAIPAMFAGKGPNDAVRAWVPGCATGEEAYSIAMLLSEHAATLAEPPQLQVFATDIDEQGYAFGRDAIYPAGAVTDIPADRLRTWFTQEAGGYRVIKPLRERVLFAVHNLLHDPPFSKLDLVSCRNLLIYLQAEAQEHALQTFHYALRSGGVLLLGASESAGGGLFRPISTGQSLFRRVTGTHRLPHHPSAAPPRGIPRTVPAVADRRANPFSYGALHLRLLEEYAPPSLVVDDRLDVVHLSGRAGDYLQHGAGEPSQNLISLVRGDLRLELRAALQQAFERGVASSVRVRMDDGGTLGVQVHPFTEPDAGRFALVIFHDPLERDAEAGARHATPANASLEEELLRTKELLESTAVARDRTVEALQAANEELQSINEEQKSAAEELETSREEIQSINEELTTINQEHQNTIEELRRTNADLQNLIASTEIATLFLDRETRIRRYTPAAARLFDLTIADRGKHLSQISHRLEYPTLEAEVQGVLASQLLAEREVASGSQWYMARINAYQAPDGSADGAVISFLDITAQKKVEGALRAATVAAESANAAKGSFLATLAHEFRTPLTGMMGYADVLRLDSTLSASNLLKIDRITACGWHLSSMIDLILTFAKLDEGLETARVERVDAGALAREALQLVEPLAEAKGLSLRLDLPDQPLEVDTDGHKLRVVLVNLCGNAVKYTESGEIGLTLRADAERVVFEVSDTGVGIAEEHRSRVFDRYWQVDGVSGPSRGGMGIGLAAAREFSHLLGGDIELQSQIGVGSTFRLWLPRGDANGAASSPSLHDGRADPPSHPSSR